MSASNYKGQASNKLVPRQARSLTPVAAALMVALSAYAPHAALAQDAPTVEQLQAEVAKLKAELAQKNEELAAKNQASGAAQPATGAAAPEPIAADKSTTSAQAKADQPAQLKKVVVRAKPKLASVQDVPQSISVISGQDLNDQLALGIGAISQRAADVVRGTGNSRTFAMLIRGVGKVTQTEAQDTSVGIIQDGVNYAYAPLGSFDFYDMDTIEVAKGPQGTLGGHNFTVGTVSVTTKNPTFTQEANWALTLGQNSTIISQIAGGGPVIDDILAWRGALIVDKGNGPYSNAYNPDQTYFNTDRVSGRIKLLFTPNPDFSALATFEMQPTGSEFYNSGVVTLAPPTHYSNNGVAIVPGSAFDVAGKLGRSWFTNQLGGENFYYNGLLNTTTIDTNSQNPLYTWTNGASLKLNENLGDYDVTSLTATRNYHFDARNDDQTPFSISVQGGGKVDRYQELSEELSLSNKPGGFVDWKTGIYLWGNIVNYDENTPNTGYGQDAGAYYASNSQYTTLDANAVGQLLMENSLNGLNKGTAQSIRNQSASIFGQADWHLTDLATLTTGLRLQYEVRTNDTNSELLSYGSGGTLLNPSVTPTGVLLGGFNSDSTGTLTTTGLTPAQIAAQAAVANKLAQQYFGVSSYAGLSTGQKAQVAAAKAIRASQIGTIWNEIDGPAFRKTMPGLNISPSYKFTPTETGYVSFQYGEKGGVSQVVNGVPVLAAPEKADSFELGLKSAFLNRSLLLNADIFKSIIHNYQQVEAIVDPLAPTTTISFTGNAPQVDIYGLELDSSYVANRDLTLRGSGSYTIAKYENFPNSPLPLDDQTVGTNATQNVSGQLLPGAARLTFNIGADYKHPVWGDKLFHASFNTAYTSRYNSDPSLSNLCWIPAHFTTDASIGLGRLDQKFDVSLIVKNLFNDLTPQSYSLSTSSPSAYSYIPALPRWIGIQLSGKF